MVTRRRQAPSREKCQKDPEHKKYPNTKKEECYESSLPDISITDYDEIPFAICAIQKRFLEALACELKYDTSVNTTSGDRRSSDVSCTCNVAPRTESNDYRRRICYYFQHGDSDIFHGASSNCSSMRRIATTI